MNNPTGKSGGTLLREKALDKALSALHKMLDENEAVLAHTKRVIEAQRRAPESRPEIRSYHR